MTPEERAAQVCFPEHNRVVYDHIVMVIRAALAERDRAWQAAFDSYVLTGTEPMCRHCSGLLRDAIDPTSCEHCQPLRALLAAGKGRTE